MLTYEELKETFCDLFPDVMGEEFEGYEVKTMPVVKRGKTLDGFTFSPKNSVKAPTVQPTYYFEDIYKSYQSSRDIMVELCNVADSMKKALIKGRSISSGLNLDAVKKNVVAELVNPGTASIYINDVPHRPFLDLCIIYRWVITSDDTGVYSSIIDNRLMDMTGLDEEELYSSAMKNTCRLLSPKIKSFDSVVRSVLRKNGQSEAQIRKTIGKTDPEKRVYMLTNKSGFRASSGIIFEEVREKIALKAESDYFIVPTSVNECLIVPVVSGIPPECLIEMLRESNECYLSDGEQMLSSSLYFCDADNFMISVFNMEEKIA
ncbi:MAG: hypothetical protein IKN80_08435 [Clostridiales bacterium]|nr:hypothetical protein [Clostridiales bacterium]